MLHRRYVATPFGVRVDYITPAGEVLYSQYLANSTAAMSVPPKPRFWRPFVCGAVSSVMLQVVALGCAAAITTV